MSVMDSLLLALAVGKQAGSGGGSAADQELAKSIVERTITTLHNDSLTEIGSSGMRHCLALTDVVLPNVHTLGQYAFYQCTALKRVDLPKVSYVSRYAFGNCTTLEAVILRSQRRSLSDANMFTGSSIEAGTGYIYVPAAWIDSYKESANWGVYANQLRALEDYTVDGTVTGALDESKISA